MSYAGISFSGRLKLRKCRPLLTRKHSCCGAEIFGKTRFPGLEAIHSRGLEPAILQYRVARARHLSRKF